MLPWWIDIAIAIIAYFWLHSVAISEIVVVAQPGKIGKQTKCAFGYELAGV
jgi:restriction system protein